MLTVRSLVVSLGTHVVLHDSFVGHNPKPLQTTFENFDMTPTAKLFLKKRDMHVLKYMHAVFDSLSRHELRTYLRKLPVALN